MASESRIVTAGIGALFVVLAVLIVCLSGNGWPAWLAALVVGGLGVDALVSALRKRRCLLARLGPLP